MIPLPGFQNPTPYLALTVDRNSYTSLLISCQKRNISTVNTYISHIRWMASSTQYQPKLSPVCNTCNLSLLITRLKKKCFSRFGRLIYKQWCTGLATSEFRPAESHLAITLQHTCILSDLTLVYHYLQYEGKIIFFIQEARYAVLLVRRSMKELCYLSSGKIFFTTYLSLNQVITVNCGWYSNFRQTTGDEL